jgi:hypothetical protein
MEGKGLVTSVEDRAAGTVDYIRTDLAIAPEPVLGILLGRTTIARAP